MDVIVPAVIGLSTAAGFLVIAPTVKYALDIYPYLYANTRASARSGMLFNKRFYEELAAASNLTELFALLEEGYYAHVCEHAKDFVTFSGLLEEDLFNTYKWLLNFAPPAVKATMKAMMNKFEVNEFKNIMNKLRNGEELGEIKFIIDPDLRIKLEEVKDFNSLAGSLAGTQYESIFTGKNLDDIGRINALLDKHYFESVLNVIKKCKDDKAIEPFKIYWKNMIDLMNIRLVIRKLSGSAEDCPFIDTGFLSAGELSGVSDVAQIENVFAQSVYAEAFSGVKGEDIEKKFYSFLKKQAGVMSAKYTLKSGAVVKFIVMKELEIRNLNIVVKLKSEGYGNEDIQNLLVM